MKTDIQILTEASKKIFKALNNKKELVDIRITKVDEALYSNQFVLNMYWKNKDNKPCTKVIMGNSIPFLLELASKRYESYL